LVEQYSSFSVEWGVKVLQTPHVVPVAENNQRTFIYGLLENGNIGDTIHVNAKGPNGPITWDVKTTHKIGNTIKRFVAFALIRDLQEGKSPFHFTLDNLKVVNPPEPQIKSEIIRLGVKYQLATKHTSFIAVEEINTPTMGTLETVEVDTKQPTYSMKHINEQMKKERLEAERKQLEESRREEERKCQEEKMKVEDKIQSHTLSGMFMKLQPSDALDEAIDIPIEVAYMSVTVKNMLEDLGSCSDCAVPLHNVPKKILDIIVEYCTYHTNHSSTISWDENFCKSYQAFLPEILLAANYLDIQSLFELCENFIKNKSKEIVKDQHDDYKMEQKKSEEVGEVLEPQLQILQTQSQVQIAPRVVGGYEQLVGKQQFTGSWDAQSIAQVANIPLQQILQVKLAGISDEVWATACGIALLKLHWSASKSIWGMVAKKARVFIIKELSKEGIDTTTATNKAKQIIKAAKKELH